MSGGIKLVPHRHLRALAAAAMLASVGLAPTRLVPQAEGGLLFQTTTTAQIHNAAHVQAGQWPLGTTVHLYVKVTASGTRSIPTGYVEVRRYSGAGCAGTLQKTVKVKLDGGGDVDVLGSAYKSATPVWVYFKASYLGSGTFAPSTTVGCYGVNIAATPKIAFVMHDADHHVITGDIPVGQPVHPYVTVTGDWGTPVGGVQGRLFWDELYTDPCTNSYGQTEFANLEGGKAEVEANWTGHIVRKGWVQILFSITGDGPNYSSEFSACLPISFKGKPNITSEARTPAGDVATTVKVGGNVVLGATVTGSIGEISGDVRFRLWKGTTCSGAPAVERVAQIDLYGSAATQLTMSVAGTRAYQATYLGNVIYMARSSTCKTFTVSSATPSATPGLPASTAPTNPANTPGATIDPLVTEAPTSPATTAAPAETIVPSAAATPAPQASSASGAIPVPSAIPVSNVVGSGDLGLLIVALFVFGIGLLVIGVVAGVLISRRGRSAASR